MNHIKLFSLLFLMIIIHPGLYAQHAWGVKASAGASCIWYNQKNDPPMYYTIKNYYRPSGQVGMFYTYRFKEKFSVGSELLFLPVFSKKYFGNLRQNVYEYIYFHFDYIGMPFYFGYTFNKLNINLGMQANFMLASRAKEEVSYDYNGEHITATHYYNNLGIKKYDLGGRVGLMYKLSKKLTAEANFYYGFLNLTKGKDDRKYLIYKVRQITAGMRYQLFSSEQRRGHQK